MSFDSLGRYNPSHKVWDHSGNIIPQVEHSEGIRPAGEFKTAAWLPVQFFDKYYENWMVVLPGKILAFDGQGRLCPAQYGLDAATITYTTSDVEAGVIDCRTGAALLSNATGTFAVSGVADFMGTGEAMSVSKPVGVAPYAFLQWAGDGSSLDDGFNPAAYRNHNYNMQHRVAFLCDYVLELPLVPAAATDENLTEDSWASSKTTFAALANLPVAINTVRTEITFTDGTQSDADTRFVNQVDSTADVLALGDWHINYTTGVITCYKATSGFGGGNLYHIAYSHYASSPTGANVSVFASAVGDLKAGQFVKCNADSNFAVADSDDTFQDIVGQVLEVESVLDKDMLGQVRTAYLPAIGTDASGAYPGYTGQMDQMAGSATGGVDAKVHYAGAADRVVRINLVSR